MTKLSELPQEAHKEGYITVFLTLQGSRLQGTHTYESDYDYLGACIEPIEKVIGLGKFEQHEWKKSDSEGTTYSLRKYIKLLIEGNPTILASAFSPIAYDSYGITTPEFHKMFVSRKAGPKFAGYMASQIKRIHTTQGMHVTRAALIDQYGYDTKYAAHVIRLGFQGIEYLRTGHIQLPMEEQYLSVIMSIRNGAMDFETFLMYANLLLKDVDKATEESTLPEEPDYDAISRWLCDVYQYSWGYV